MTDGSDPVCDAGAAAAVAVEPAIEFVRVTCAFGGRRVLGDISLSFAPASVTAIIGASGCGKSTLLKLCNGLLRPSGGVVRAFGADLDYRHLPALRRRMGYAVQGTGLFPHLTAHANITLAARMADWTAPNVDTRLRELLALMQVDDSLLTRYPHQLSGGQQQRVGLCRAMMLRPEVLLLDEPFAAIDPITRRDIHEQLLELLAVEPVTVLLVTHDMREAMQLASRIVVLGGGRVVADQAVDDLRAGYPGMEPEALLDTLLPRDDAQAPCA